jgi:hypothetical protein
VKMAEGSLAPGPGCSEHATERAERRMGTKLDEEADGSARGLSLAPRGFRAGRRCLYSGRGGDQGGKQREAAVRARRLRHVPGGVATC